MRLPAPSHSTHFLYTSRDVCAAGQVHNAAFMPNNSGLPRDKLRILGRYSLSYLLDGKGIYRDATGRTLHVHGGDCLLILPDLGSTFAPLPGDHWSCFYMQFSGPLFDWWREHELLDPSRIVYHLKPAEKWLAKMQAVYAPVETPRGGMVVPNASQRVARLLAVLADIARFGVTARDDSSQPWWLWQAQHLLEHNLSERLTLEDVASALNVSAETFRKQFRAHTGVAPMQYRLQKRLEAAMNLLQHSEHTGKEIAQRLGFPDEPHFSRLFSKHFGSSPRAFRRGLRSA